MNNRNLHIVRPDEPEEVILIEHGFNTLLKAKELSEYIKSLPLSTEENDKLVNLLIDQLMIAEHETYIQGFIDGMSSAQTGDFSVIADKIVKVAPINFN